jgi:hypothetical protein
MEVLLFGAFLGFVVATHQAPEPAPVPPEPDRAILLPDPDGQVGRLTITTTAGTQEIAQAFGAVAATPEGQLSAYAETPDSVKARDAETRPAAEIRVIGHTDTVGAADTNEALSLRRAEAIVQALRDFGIRPQSFEAVGRGEMDPLVPTPDATAEPRNRRVEVSIR